MEASNLILALFFSDETKIIYESIKHSQIFDKKKKKELKLIAFRFLGPIFFTSATISGRNWQFELIESTLLLRSDKLRDADLLQSFFIINSMIESEGKTTNLSAIIGSPYTEDITLIRNKIVNYIHPCIIQSKIVNESIFGNEFNLRDFIFDELGRGKNLIEHSLGSSRKMYWEEQQKYYVVGIIERKSRENTITTTLYTLDLEDQLRIKVLSKIPSFYVITILPDYYEKRINETLYIFDKTKFFPNIKMIKLRKENDAVIYLEEFSMINDTKVSYGLILISENQFTEKTNKLSYYSKKLREILNTKEEMEIKRKLARLNPRIDPFYEWNANTEEELKKIQLQLDNMD